MWRERFGSREERNPSRSPEPSGSTAAEGERLFGVVVSPAAFERAMADPAPSPRELAFVDIETTGLGDVPIFLVGILRAVEGQWELCQLLAPDPSAEPELLAASARRLASRPVWVSYNGRSFDVPRLRARCRRLDVEWPPGGEHRDLLGDVRRLWKGALPDCRLGTVQERVLGLERPSGDVPGREVPERYADFVAGGELRWLAPVVEHNRCDVAALVALLARIEGEG